MCPIWYRVKLLAALKVRKGRAYNEPHCLVHGTALYFVEIGLLAEVGLLFLGALVNNALDERLDLGLVGCGKSCQISVRQRH